MEFSKLLFRRYGVFALLVAGGFLGLCGGATAGNAGDKEIQLKPLVPTLDLLPARKLLKGSVGHFEGLESAYPVNIFGYASEAKGTKDVKNEVVTYVKPYTAAWRSGLSAGDKVLATTVQLPQALLTIERNGRKFSCLMETKQQLPLGLKGEIKKEKKSDAEILSDYAVVVLVDSSASMQTADCPGIEQGAKISRWQWCREHMKDLYVIEAINRGKLSASGSGISIITFDSNFRSHRNCSSGELPRIFADGEPSGETFMAPAMAEAFALVRNQLNYDKPAMIVVISDGRANDGDLIKKTIISQVNTMRKPELLSVLFLEVGSSSPLLKELDADLIKEGARADVVSVLSFSKATGEGLVKSLASTVAPKPVEPIKGAVKKEENLARSAVSQHIFLPGKDPPKMGSGVPQVVKHERPAPRPPVKARPTGTLEAKAGSLPQEVDEKEQVLRRNANRTYP